VKGKSRTPRRAHDVVLNEAAALYEAGNVAGARRVLQDALACEPDDVLVLFAAAALDGHLGRRRQSLAGLRAVRKASPSTDAESLAVGRADAILRTHAWFRRRMWWSIAGAVSALSAVALVAGAANAWAASQETAARKEQLRQMQEVSARIEVEQQAFQDAAQAQQQAFDAAVANARKKFERDAEQRQRELDARLGQVNDNLDQRQQALDACVQDAETTSETLACLQESLTSGTS
jgi:hypothetical protein